MSEFKTLAEKISADTAARKARYTEFELWWAEAEARGTEAALAVTPNPMTVQEVSSGQTWHVSEGVCGFAWVVVTPGSSSFARWAYKFKKARSEYGGGVCVRYVGEFGQSYERKRAFAAAFAGVLRFYGIHAASRSRLD